MCFNPAMATRKVQDGAPCAVRHLNRSRKRDQQYGQASRLISTGRLNASPRLHRRPIDQVFSLVPSVSSRDMGCLISGRASRLDAFSGYPSRTWLPGACRWRDPAAGATTGAPEVRPARSSRTKARPPQTSNAHGR